MIQVLAQASVLITALLSATLLGIFSSRADASLALGAEVGGEFAPKEEQPGYADAA